MKEKDGNFTAKCIKAETRQFTKGKEYKIVNGLMLNDDGRVYRNNDSIRKLNAEFRSQFELVPEEPNLTTITIYNTPGSPKVSAVMRRGDTVIKSAKAVCNATDTFSLDFGTELAVKRLFGWEEKAKPVISTSKEVVAVTRHAKPDEWIEIVNASDHSENNYKNGDVKQVATESKNDNGVYINGDFGRYNVWNFAGDAEYVVLENYHPETPSPVKFRKAKVGDRIKIVKVKAHKPTVIDGDISTVIKEWNDSTPGIKTSSRNIFYDKDEEYIILNR